MMTGTPDQCAERKPSRDAIQSFDLNFSRNRMEGQCAPVTAAVIEGPTWASFHTVTFTALPLSLFDLANPTVQTSFIGLSSFLRF